MKFRLSFISAYLVSFMAQRAFACPNCKDFLATEGARSLAQGYYWSIVVMLSLPFLLTGLIAFLIYRANRTNQLIRNPQSTVRN